MSTIYVVSFVVLFVLQAITTPVFLKAEIPNPCKKSLFWKMVCATIFVVTGFVSMLCTGNKTMFAVLMLIGLGFSWLGDFLLHVKAGDRLFFVLGLFSFLIAHVFYVSAYSTAFNFFFPNEPFMSVPEVVTLILLTSTGLFSTIYVLKLDFGIALLPITLYMNTIGLMIIKAFSLGISFISSHATGHSVLVALLLIFGAACFGVSDFTLSILCFKKGVKKNGWLRNVNIFTYFFGQMFLALTINYIIPT